MALPDRNDASFEEDLAVLTQFVEAEEDSLWAQATWMQYMTGKWGRGAAPTIAQHVKRDESYVRQMVATAVAFPDPAQRAQDLSFSHHRFAAMTEDPDHWIDQAVQHSWSVRELQDAIQDAKDGVEQAEAARRARDRIENSIKKYNERWTPITDLVARVVWAHRTVGASADTSEAEADLAG